MSFNVIEGDFAPQEAKYGIVVARFNSFIVESLLAGAIDALKRHGGVKEESIDVVRVPGAYELPLVAQAMAANGDYDAIIALGAVIRGSTPHFDFVAGEASKGLAQVGLSHELPVIFGVLTTDTIEQALERAGGKVGNKGEDAVLAAIETARLLQQVS